MHLFNDSISTTFLTPNSRLSAALLKQHHQEQLFAKKNCWPTLDVLPLTTWLTRLWHDYTAQHITSHRKLLESTQEQLIWDDILRDSPEGEYLLQLSRTAELAKSAWKILKAWRLDPQENFFNMSEDSLIFQKWAQQYQQLCEENDWLDSSSLPDFIIEQITLQKITPPKKIVLVGFTEISPQHQNLLDTCLQFGSEIDYFTPETIDNLLQRISLLDEKTELYTLAKWAKTTYEQHPNASIGCVIPDLQNLRERILRIFSEVFSNEDSYTLNHTVLPFNISAGKKLSDYPIINTALQLLNLKCESIDINLLSSLLRSPFIGEGEQELIARSQTEYTLRRHNVNTSSLKHLIDHFNLNQYCPFLAERLQSYQKFAEDLPKKQSPSEWVATFMQQLTLLGWPGERSLNSHEFQVVKNAWLTLLEEYASYDLILNNITQQKALLHLTYLVNNTMFQPQSPETAPIHILGVLEAADISFDHLWVMGLDDTTWPALPKPNPFIPLRIQKKYQMPHATAERELIYCQQLTEQFKRSGKHVIFSHAMHRENIELRISPLISTIPEITLDQLALNFTTPVAERIFSIRSAEMFNDDKVNSVSAIDKIRGGTSIFKLQAACPFRAFAELRLHAKQIDPPTLGLHAKERGEILHKAMELIWRQLRNKITLDKLSDEALLTLIRNSIKSSLLGVFESSKQESRYAKIEFQRLEKMIWKWLQLEKKRHPFEVIFQEQERSAHIGTIPITFRVDRIDQLENGKYVIIDYKTGKNISVKSWFGERPDEPQLPLYCISDPMQTVGILFAQLNAEKLQWEGISELSIGFDSVKPLEKVKHTEMNHWLQQVEQWQKTLENLGRQFMQGEAKVDPKSSIDTCQHCHLHTLCRVNEIAYAK